MTSNQKYFIISLEPFTAKNGQTYKVIGTRAEPHAHDVKNLNTGEIRKNVEHKIVKKWQTTSIKY